MRLLFHKRGVPISSPSRQPKARSIALNEDSVNYSTKASVSKVSSPASKFIGFKVYILQRSSSGATRYSFKATVGKG